MRLIDSSLAVGSAMLSKWRNFVKGEGADCKQLRCSKYGTSLGLTGARHWSWLGEPAERVDADWGPTLAGADPKRLRRAVERVLWELNPEIVLTVGSDGLTGHPDHVALADAIREANSIVEVPEGIWGARLHADDVRAGEDLLHAVAPKVQIGSGRVSGTDAPLMTRDVRAWALSRRRALDAYRNGLGTGSLESLVHGVAVAGDSVLLRGVFDSTEWEWSIERYEAVLTRKDCGNDLG